MPKGYIIIWPRGLLIERLPKEEHIEIDFGDQNLILEYQPPILLTTYTSSPLDDLGTNS